MAEPIKAAEVARKQEFMLKRAEALEAYNRVEQGLCACLAYFGGMSNIVAGTIFFKISAARSRREILDKLKSLKMGVNHAVFWNSLLALSATLDDERNKIVHWAVGVNIALETNPDGQTIASEMMTFLRPPNFWSWGEGTAELLMADLTTFIAHCDIIGRSLVMFVPFLKGELPEEARDTWREIFQQSLVYQLPPDHPLYRKPITP